MNTTMTIGVARRILTLWKCGEANFTRAIIDAALKTCGDLK
jgi:hypothetical protein